jgi:hypothetical protein
MSTFVFSKDFLGPGTVASLRTESPSREAGLSVTVTQPASPPRHWMNKKSPEAALVQCIWDAVPGSKRLRLVNPKHVLRLVWIQSEPGPRARPPYSVLTMTIKGDVLDTSTEKTKQGHVDPRA